MYRFKPFSLNIRGKLPEYTRPVVMGILNATPDSFFAGSRVNGEQEIARRAIEMITAGAEMLDIGGCSTRPGYQAPSAIEETDRVVKAVRAVRNVDEKIVISVDTFRASVAEAAIEAGADIINDISAFTLDDRLFDTVVKQNVPYILMHPSESSLDPEMGKEETVATVINDLQHELRRLTLAGVNDVIIDPGFGFGKTLQQNYWLMDELERIERLGCPVLVGISRKSMINRVIGTTPEMALNGTTILNTVALTKGASILRVHDVAQAKEAVDIISQFR